jgi:hypothetical protein
VSANGAFTFATRISGAYNVTVLTSPAGQNCTVANPSGTAIADVTNVAVTCAPLTYTVGGTVAGLPAGASVVLQDNGADNLTVGANGAFTFATHVNSGTSYVVTVLSTTPNTVACTASNASGTIAAANVTSVQVTCSNVTYTVGGTLNGLASGQTVVLQNNGADNLTLNATGTFTFATRAAQGAGYAVTVLTQPATQTCTVTNGTGSNLQANVTNVTVSCVNTYTVGGTVVGLPPGSGNTVVLRNNGGNDLSVSQNGAFTFTNRLANSAAYAVTVQTQPAGAFCTVANGSGTVAAANVTNVQVNCALQRWVAPTTWAAGGPSGTAWPDAATMVQHAYFTQGGIQELKGVTWAPQGSPTTSQSTAFPVAKYGAGPFNTEGQRFVATAGDTALDVNGDFTVCAIFKPGFDPIDDGREYPIISRGFGNATDTIAHGSWVLMQMHEAYCFHYEYTDANGNPYMQMAFTRATPPTRT